MITDLMLTSYPLPCRLGLVGGGGSDHLPNPLRHLNMQLEARLLVDLRVAGSIMISLPVHNRSQWQDISAMGCRSHISSNSTNPHLGSSGRSKVNSDKLSVSR